MNSLKFKRQFLFTAKKCLELEDWNIENLETHYLYTHPDTEVTRVSKVNLELILIGHLVNPKFPDHSILDILNDMSDFVTIDDISKKLYGLVGRFVLMIKKNDTYTFFHDACGLKLLFYTKYKDALYAASQPLLLKLVTDVREGENYQEYYASEYVIDNKEHFIPSGASLYENVHQLVPNHYLDVSNFKQIRYWPVKELKKESFENSLDEFSTLIQQTMIAINKKFTLALPLTAGWDSRIILSGCKDIYKDVWFYTLQFRNLNLRSNDLRIPLKLSSKLGLQYKIIDCTKPLDQKFSEIYINNTDIPHLHDWGEMAYAMHEEYPSKRMNVKGNCSEIGRCAVYRSGEHPEINSINDFLSHGRYAKLDEWNNIDFIREKFSEWFEEVKRKDVNFGYDLFDLFYWEHRMGSWQAQNQLEFDIVQEAFTPFNNRELLDIMLRIDPLYRCGSDNLLFTKTMENLWPEVLSEPINPPYKENRIISMIKNILKKIGIFDAIKAMIGKIK